jgi:hypothetical protein
LEELLRRILDETIQSQALRGQPLTTEEIKVPEDVSFLFSIRYEIEKELRRIWHERFGLQENRRPVSVNQPMQSLLNAELMNPALARVVREVYSMCSPAIHGEDVSDSQVKFVRDIAPELLASLKAI